MQESRAFNINEIWLLSPHFTLPRIFNLTIPLSSTCLYFPCSCLLFLYCLTYLPFPRCLPPLHLPYRPIPSVFPILQYFPFLLSFLFLPPTFIPILFLSPFLSSYSNNAVASIFLFFSLLLLLPCRSLLLDFSL